MTIRWPDRAGANHFALAGHGDAAFTGELFDY
jgi:hypothetical protein